MVAIAYHVLGLLLISYFLFVGQITIHMCVHNTLFRSRSLNRWVGSILASIQLANFEGWRAAHLLHHRYTNTERDPYLVDMGAARYVLTQYFRHVRAFWDARKYVGAVAVPVLVASGIVIWQGISGHFGRGLLWVTCFWLIPVYISHILVAHFNYITHVGLPVGRGVDTRSFTGGIWWLVNKFTFNFYYHKEHHMSPGEAIPTPAMVSEPAADGQRSPQV